jgi:hypothetical protein
MQLLHRGSRGLLRLLTGLLLDAKFLGAVSFLDNKRVLDGVTRS